MTQLLLDLVQFICIISLAGAVMCLAFKEK
jgi:hypothetical protein